MEFKDAFDLVLKQTALVNEYWKFYSAVALAVLGATVGSDKFKSSKTTVFAVLAAFWLFSIGNLAAIAKGHAVSVQLVIVANQLAAASPQLKNVTTSLAKVWEVCAFHVICDIGLTLAVLFVAAQSWKQHAAPKLNGQATG
jgi:hypothetical protein